MVNKERHFCIPYLDVRAQSTLGWDKTFLPENIIKNNKMPEFYMLFVRKKLAKLTNFKCACPKIPEFYMTFA